MKLYVPLTVSAYECSNIIGVFDSYEAAEKAWDDHYKYKGESFPRHAKRIEEYELNEA
jgi:hypothetical protein